MTEENDKLKETVKGLQQTVGPWTASPTSPQALKDRLKEVTKEKEALVAQHLRLQNDFDEKVKEKTKEERLKLQKERSRLQEQSADFDKKYGERASQPEDQGVKKAHSICATLQEVIFQLWTSQLTKSEIGAHLFKQLAESMDKSKIAAINEVLAEAKKMQGENSHWAGWKVEYDIDTKLFWFQSPWKNNYWLYFDLGKLYNLGP